LSVLRGWLSAESGQKWKASGGGFAGDWTVKTVGFAESFSERMSKGGQNILRKVAFVPVTAAQQVMEFSKRQDVSYSSGRAV
jgi:hypothetical protein